MSNHPKKATNNDITRSLEQLNQGDSSGGNQLVFDPSTGEFVIARPNQAISPDATTINSIAKDGFACH
jgi:hypothetical protein